jgi:hypothetical protein
LVIAALAVFSFTLSIYVVLFDSTAAFFSPLTRLWELSAGALLILREREGRFLPPHIVSSASWLGAILIGFSMLFLAPNYPFPGLLALPVVLGTMLLISAGAGATLNRVVLARRPVVVVGLISYPLYLWHWPLLSFAHIWNFEAPLPAFVRLVLLALATLLAGLTYRFIERPWKKAHPIVLFSAMLAIGLTAAGVWLARGLTDRPINRDERRQFVAHYQELHRTGLQSYRPECDFMAWGTNTFRDQIAPSCTAPGGGRTAFLWGDSHAQALSQGLREALPAGMRLAQVATSGCSPTHVQPQFELFATNNSWRAACAKSNQTALAAIDRLNPELVIITQYEEQLSEDWDALGRHLRRLGAKRVILLGHLPQWHPSLPLVIARNYWPLRQNHIATGLAPWPFNIDRELSLRSKEWQSVEYVSIVQRLCIESGCLATIDGGLMAVDYAHLTPAGSRYVGQTVLAPFFRSQPKADSLGAEASGRRP